MSSKKVEIKKENERKNLKERKSAPNKRKYIPETSENINKTQNKERKEISSVHLISFNIQ